MKYGDLIAKTKDAADLEPTCPICVDDFAKDTEVKMTPCKHVFHNDCLFEWINTKLDKPDCPFCRTLFKLDL